MAILVDERTRVVVQGITGREGTARALLMREYGTRVVAGVTPSKKGQSVQGIPVFDSVAQAWRQAGPLDVSVVFVPAPLVKNAAMEAMDAGVKLVVLVADRVPLWDAIDLVAFARSRGARFVGPNTLGIISAGKALLGMIGGRATYARDWFRPGHVGVVSRSGGMTSAMAYYTCEAGLGISTAVHVGGDAIIGMRLADVLRDFQQDPDTYGVVLFGEIGTTQEEEVAGLVTSGAFTKPVVAYIGGRSARAGTRFSHAGAIVEGRRGSYESKVETLRAAGIAVADSFDQTFELARRAFAA
jgi:succinyl-CoA synthetase alpha subunit